MHRLDGRSDEDLAALAAHGEAQSFAILAERYRVKAMRVAYGIVHNRADAEDAVQNAFIRIYRNLGKGRQFSSWLYKIVINESVRLLRGRRETSDEIVEIPTEDADIERIMLVRKCLASLPKNYRTVLALRGIEELAYEEIAEILGVPVGTVRSRLHEGRRLFAKCWKELMSDEE
ncbi:MAG TPA: sigma-70 family RNA polymerase sigma factor [Armatimonadota bacterium]|nr:sigma-70 family RNA polymerase sigma factor [Armatimonadota bacterium]